MGAAKLAKDVIWLVIALLFLGGVVYVMTKIGLTFTGLETAWKNFWAGTPVAW